MKLSIVIPVYNEGKVIKKTISNVEKAVSNHHELLIVYDMKEDSTIKPTKEISAQYPNVKLIKNEYGNGALNALKTGLRKSKGEAVCVMMADLTDDPIQVMEMVSKFDEGNDVVAASRYMKGGRQKGGPIIKQILSRAAGISLYYLVGLPTHDATNSFRLYSKKFLNKIEIESDGGFELALELTVKAYFNGFKVSEVPTSWIYEAKESRFLLKKWLPKYLKWYLWAIKKRLQGLPKN